MWLIAHKNDFSFRGFAPLLYHWRLLNVLQTLSEYQEIFLLLQSQTYWGGGTKHNQTRKKKKQKEETLISLSVKSTEKLTRSNCCDFLLIQICNRATNSSPKQYHFHRINFALSSLLLTSNLQKNDTYQSALNTNHHGTSSQLGWKF